MAEPIHLEIIRAKKEILKDVGTIAGLDRGCSLTKVLYIPKKETDSEYYDLTCATFLNSNFYDGLMWLVNNGHLPNSGTIGVTGVGCDKFRDLIEEKTGLQVRFVDEMFTMIKGNHFLIKHFTDSAICYPKIEIPKTTHQYSGKIKWLAEQSLQTLVDLKTDRELHPLSEDIRFPAIVGTFGSAAGIFVIREDGKAILAGGTMMSGRTFIGLSKLLLKTENYDEIMALAEKGDISVLGKHIQLHQPTDSDPQFNGEFNFPLFAFGNIKPNTKLSELKREDVALSLVHFLANHLYFILSHSAANKKINRIYFAGNLTRSPFLQKVLCEKFEFYSSDLMELNFLKTGHSGAIGAMVTKPHEDDHFEMKFF